MSVQENGDGGMPMVAEPTAPPLISADAPKRQAAGPTKAWATQLEVVPISPNVEPVAPEADTTSNTIGGGAVGSRPGTTDGLRPISGRPSSGQLRPHGLVRSASSGQLMATTSSQSVAMGVFVTETKTDIASIANQVGTSVSELLRSNQSKFPSMNETSIVSPNVKLVYKVGVQSQSIGVQAGPPSLTDVEENMELPEQPAVQAVQEQTETREPPDMLQVIVEQPPESDPMLQIRVEQPPNPEPMLQVKVEQPPDPMLQIDRLPDVEQPPKPEPTVQVQIQVHELAPGLPTARVNILVAEPTISVVHPVPKRQPQSEGHPRLALDLVTGSNGHVTLAIVFANEQQNDTGDAEGDLSDKNTASVRSSARHAMLNMSMLGKLRGNFRSLKSSKRSILSVAESNVAEHSVDQPPPRRPPIRRPLPPPPPPSPYRKRVLPSRGPDGRLVTLDAVKAAPTSDESSKKAEVYASKRLIAVMHDVRMGRNAFQDLKLGSVVAVRLPCLLKVLLEANTENMVGARRNTVLLALETLSDALARTAPGEEAAVIYQMELTGILGAVIKLCATMPVSDQDVQHLALLIISNSAWMGAESLLVDIGAVKLPVRVLMAEPMAPLLARRAAAAALFNLIGIEQGFQAVPRAAHHSILAALTALVADPDSHFVALDAKKRFKLRQVDLMMRRAPSQAAVKSAEEVREDSLEGELEKAAESAMRAPNAAAARLQSWFRSKRDEGFCSTLLYKTEAVAKPAANGEPIAGSADTAAPELMSADEAAASDLLDAYKQSVDELGARRALPTAQIKAEPTPLKPKKDGHHRGRIVIWAVGWMKARYYRDFWFCIFLIVCNSLLLAGLPLLYDLLFDSIMPMMVGNGGSCEVDFSLTVGGIVLISMVVIWLEYHLNVSKMDGAGFIPLFQRELCSHISRLPQQRLDRTVETDLLAMMEKDVSRLNNVISASFEMLTAVLELTFLTPVLFWMQPELAAFCIACIPAIIVFQYRQGSFVMAATENVNTAENRYMRVIEENLVFATTRKLLGLGPTMDKMLEHAQEEVVTTFDALDMREARSTAQLGIFNLILRAGIIGLGVTLILFVTEEAPADESPFSCLNSPATAAGNSSYVGTRYRPRLTIATLFAFIQGSDALFPICMRIISCLRTFQIGASAVVRVLDYLEDDVDPWAEHAENLKRERQRKEAEVEMLQVPHAFVKTSSDRNLGIRLDRNVCTAGFKL